MTSIPERTLLSFWNPENKLANFEQRPLTTFDPSTHICGVTRQGSQIRLNIVQRKDYTWLKRLIGFLFHLGPLAHFSVRPTLIARRLEELHNDPLVQDIVNYDETQQGTTPNEVENVERAVKTKNGLRYVAAQCHNCALPALFTNMLAQKQPLT